MEDECVPRCPERRFTVLMRCADRSTSMDVTIIGLQNAGKTSLVRVLAVCSISTCTGPCLPEHQSRVGKVLTWYLGRRVHHRVRCSVHVIVGVFADQCSSIPTVAFNKKEVKKGHVSIKWCVLSFWYSAMLELTGISWDLGGQPRFRSMWERYCRGVNAIM